MRRLQDDVLVAADLDADGRDDIVAVPSERVLLLAVALPPGDPRRRRAALPFAVEEAIADPLERVHIALGRPLGDGRWLAAVVRHEVMGPWVAALDAAGAGGAPMLPDALLLPVPAPGSWTAARDGDRVRVRCGDGTGFAVAAAQLGRLWEAAGRPPCVAVGTDIAELIEARADATAGAGHRVPVAIDLRQGRYAWRRPRDAGLRRRLAAVAAAGLAAHVAIAAADTLALRHAAQVREQEARALVAAALPGTSLGPDLLASASGLPTAPGYRRPDPLLPLLARVLAAAGPSGLRAIRYERADGKLVLAVEPGRENALATRLAAAGLAVAGGPGAVTVSGIGG